MAEDGGKAAGMQAGKGKREAVGNAQGDMETKVALPGVGRAAGMTKLQLQG